MPSVDGAESGDQDEEEDDEEGPGYGWAEDALWHEVPGWGPWGQEAWPQAHAEWREAAVAATSAQWDVHGPWHSQGSCGFPFFGHAGFGDFGEWPVQGDAYWLSGPVPCAQGGTRTRTRNAPKSHKFVPRRLKLAEEFESRRESGEPEEVTTLMIRNVPNRYTRDTLMRELDELGFAGAYDFVYLPVDSVTRCNVGYAFVNFEDPGEAARCQDTLQGYQFMWYRTWKRRVAHVSVAHIQGLEKNLEHCNKTLVLSSAAPRLQPWVRKWHEGDARPAEGAEFWPWPYVQEAPESSPWPGALDLHWQPEAAGLMDFAGGQVAPRPAWPYRRRL